MDDMISIPFEMTDETGNYTLRDAIVVTPAERENLTDEDIEAIKQNRFTNWVALIKASEEPPVEENPEA